MNKSNPTTPTPTIQDILSAEVNYPVHLGFGNLETGMCQVLVVEGAGTQVRSVGEYSLEFHNFYHLVSVMQPDIELVKKFGKAINQYMMANRASRPSLTKRPTIVGGNKVDIFDVK